MTEEIMALCKAMGATDDQEELLLPLVMAQIVDTAIPAGDVGLIFKLGALMLVWVLFLNEIRAWLVGRFVMKGVARHTARFTDEGYVIANQRGEQSFDYSSVQALCEDGRYFFLMLSRQQGNLFDKQGFHTGTADQFRAFLERKTGQTMKKL